MCLQLTWLQTTVVMLLPACLPAPAVQLIHHSCWGLYAWNYFTHWCLHFVSSLKVSSVQTMNWARPNVFGRKWAWHTLKCTSFCTPCVICFLQQQIPSKKKLSETFLKAFSRESAPVIFVTVWSRHVSAPSTLDQRTIHSLLACALKAAFQCLLLCHKQHIIWAQRDTILSATFQSVFLTYFWYRNYCQKVIFN